MRTCPQIPAWIKAFSFPRYTNAFSFLPPDCPRFYPTETLFGNWNGNVLILGKDAAPSGVMRQIVAREGVDGWRHADRARGDSGGYRTNDRLRELVDSFGIAAPLYGSATAHMLYDDPRWSRSLPGLHAGALHEHLCAVLAWVIHEMANIRAVACVGIEAWVLASTVMGHRWKSAHEAITAAREHRDHERALMGSVAAKELTATCHFHPSRGSRLQWRRGWGVLADSVK